LFIPFCTGTTTIETHFLRGLVSVSVKKLVPIKKQHKTVSAMRIFFEVISEEIFFLILKPAL
jgi:hypothetical protein